MDSGLKDLAKVVIVIIGAIILTLAIKDSVPSSPTASESTTQDSLGRSVPSSVTNDAELLISRCGYPSRDDSTDYDTPRPAIPTRMMTYNKAHLKFVYIPGGGATINDPPPYKWKFAGLMDTKTNKPVDAGHLESVIKQRLPCMLNSPP